MHGKEMGLIARGYHSCVFGVQGERVVHALHSALSSSPQDLSN